MKSADTRPILLVALGGNALIRRGETGTVEEQRANLRVPIRQIARLSRDYRILITHGNGPQVGNLLLQQEACTAVPKLPLEVLVAATQGELGYMIGSSLDGELAALGVHPVPMVVSLVTTVVVDGEDPAFAAPEKPVGPLYSAEEAASLPYPLAEVPGGRRRVVASPRPLTIVEKRQIRTLIDLGFIVICCGGGGIPVIRNGRGTRGVEAVIDKDLASACLAEEVGADILLIATDVPGAALDYGTEQELFLGTVTVKEARDALAQGHFPPGSMGPKVEAALLFLASGGKRALITAVDEIEMGLAGTAGTEISGG
ncbi:carbamate kinase [Desulfuromonas soudanensis]|uniref:Carbamate kinase n=1 Tax=Desulfuromonas soudanensis TaxID=1603606 RepID=A0A0M4D6I4_9BACT|nr:carbamate kinase [Desulfuromonas soudanensis]ALC16572.1 carbamate kinase [Desulfuromonas soudanensis]